MKRIGILMMMLTFVSCVMLYGGVSNSVHSPKVEVWKFDDGANVVYISSQPGTVEITIYNNEGVMIHTEKIKGLRGFIRPYDLSSLASGVYKIEVSDQYTTYAETVRWNMGEPREDLVAHVTEVNDNENTYLVSVPAEGADHLSLSIFDSDHNELYSTSQKVKGDFAKLYRVENQWDAVVFRIENEDGSVEHFRFE